MKKRYKKNITKLNSIHVEKFRGLENITIPFGDRITVICGKNGTSKSTILGIIAQAFSFRSDYSKEDVKKDELKKYRTILGDDFESNFSDHFRISADYDLPGNMVVNFDIYDGAENKIVSDLKLKSYHLKDRPKPRIILRGNNSRNLTHPVIYLSLERLLPITKRNEYSDISIDFLTENHARIIKLSNQILIKDISGNVCATKGTLKSMVVHGHDYDKESVSVGEDNTGQLIQALLSFDKLKKDYPDYHGGMLLIDEADAGLFPAAQVEFIKLLSKMTRDLDIQVILTTHSPTLIQEVYELAQNDYDNYKIVFLSNTFGPIKPIENPSWIDIVADLRAETIAVNEKDNFPKINVYFEDQEAADFFDALVINRKVKKVINRLKNVTLGCDQYLSLYQSGIPEFNRKSIIILDGDQKEKLKNKKYDTILTLPGTIPPDQLIFEFLSNLPDDDKYYVEHPQKFNRAVLNKITRPLRNNLNLEPVDGIMDIKELIDQQQGELPYGKVREEFKKFYKNAELQNTFILKTTNPFRYWASLNPDEVATFNQSLVDKIKDLLVNVYGVPRYQVDAYFS